MIAIILGVVLGTFAEAAVLKAGFNATNITPDLSRFKKIQLGGFAPHYPVPRSIHKNSHCRRCAGSHLGRAV